MHDLKSLACKKINPKIDFATTDYIQVKKLELILIKIALTLGCDYVCNVEFDSICPLSLKSTTDETTKDAIKNATKDTTTKDTTKDATKDSIKDTTKDATKDTTTKDATRKTSKETIKEITKKTAKQNKEKENKTVDGSESINECCCHLHLGTKTESGSYAHFKFNTTDQEVINKLNKYSFNIIIDAGGKQTILGRYRFRIIKYVISNM